MKRSDDTHTFNGVSARVVKAVTAGANGENKAQGKKNARKLMHAVSDNQTEDVPLVKRAAAAAEEMKAKEGPKPRRRKRIILSDDDDDDDDSLPPTMLPAKEQVVSQQRSSVRPIQLSIEVGDDVPTKRPSAMEQGEQQQAGKGQARQKLFDLSDEDLEVLDGAAAIKRRRTRTGRKPTQDNNSRPPAAASTERVGTLPILSL